MDHSRVCGKQVFSGHRLHVTLKGPGPLPRGKCRGVCQDSGRIRLLSGSGTFSRPGVRRLPLALVWPVAKIAGNHLPSWEGLSAAPRLRLPSVQSFSYDSAKGCNNMETSNKGHKQHQDVCVACFLQKNSHDGNARVH